MLDFKPGVSVQQVVNFTNFLEDLYADLLTCPCFYLFYVHCKQSLLLCPNGNI